MSPFTKATAQLIIKRPDGTETRIVRPKKQGIVTRNEGDSSRRDEDREAVSACPPYTASFNALLKERRDKNSRVMVSAVLERMHAEAIPLNVVTYNLLMERVVCFPDDLVFALYEEMKEEAIKENSSVRPDLTTYQLLFRACERKGQYHRAFLLYKQMRELMHITPDSPTYDTLLGFCAAVRDVAQATYFLEEMKQHGVTPNVNTYNCLMSVLVDSAPYEETLQVFQQMIEEGIKPTVRTYNTIGKAARIYGDYDRAFQLFEEMKKHGMLPNVVTYNTLLCLTEHRLDYFIGCGAHRDVQRSYEQQKQGKKSVAELALILFSEMKSTKVEPNTFTYNQLMNVLLRCGDHRVFQIYRTMQAQYNTQKEEKHFQSVRDVNKKRITQFVKDELDNNCEAFFGTDTMNTAAFNISLDELLGKEDVRRSAHIAATELRPNLDTYRIIVRACLELDLSLSCNDFYDAMLAEGLMPDYDMALLMQSVCEVNRDKSRAFEVLNEAKRAHVLIDTPLFNAYLKVLASLGDEEMIHLVKEMQLGISTFNVRPTVETFNVMLYGYLCMEKYDEVSELFSSMYLSYNQVTPNAETYCLMFQMYCKTHDVEAATQLLNSMRQRKICILVQHYHELMRVYLDSKDVRVVDVFQSLHNSTDVSLPKADAECFALVMQYYLQEEKWEALERLFTALKVDPSIEAHDGCYDVLLNMFFVQKRLEDTKSLFTELRMKCVPISIRTYNTLLRIFASAGDSFMFDILNDMKINHKAPNASTFGILLEYVEGRRVVSSAIETGLFWNPAELLVGLR